MKSFNRWVVMALLIGLPVAFLLQERGANVSTAPRAERPVRAPATGPTKPATVQLDDQEVVRAYQQRQSNVQVRGSAAVSRLLPDDNDGSRHQRFILQLSSGKTLLIAHNIDLAPRIPALQVGDVVEFYGEYEWNNLGGVVHWTHHDPGGRHVGGWLRHEGRTYQ